MFQEIRGVYGTYFYFLGVFFSNDRKNNLEIPVLLIVLKVFKEFVEQDLPTEVQKLHIN